MRNELLRTTIPATYRAQGRTKTVFLPTFVHKSGSSSLTRMGRPGSDNRAFRYGSPRKIWAPSLRVPVDPERREYLRALRQAEHSAWVADEPVGSPAPTVQASPVHAPPLPRIARDRWETRLYAAIASLALFSAVYGLWQSAHLTARWADFVRLIQTLLT